MATDGVRSNSDRGLFLDPARARVARTARLGDDAAIENLLAWLDEG